MAYATTNPYTGEVLKEFPTATDDKVREAIAQADRAFHEWKNTPVSDRVAVLEKAAQVMDSKREELAKFSAVEMGKTLTESDAEIDLCIDILRYYVKNAEELLAPRPIHSQGYKDGAAQIVREPLGVLYMVEPWNFPYYQVVRVAAPQLSAGNTLILKHASIIPQSAQAIANVFHEAGLLDGGLTNLYVSHDQTEMILGDPRVKGVALTGSERAGAEVAKVAGKHLKKSTLELGGTDAFVVLDDADIDKTVELAVMGRHWNAGQVCCAAKRMIVLDSVYDEFVEKYRAAVAQLRAGDPMDNDTQLAPLSSKEAVTRLQEQLDEAVKAGAKAEALGKPVPEQGFFFQPTILTDIPEDNPARYTEMFGPISQIYRVANEDEAIALANDSAYGLGGSVMSNDREHALRVASQINTGMIYINNFTQALPDLPFGGIGRSGYGRELTDLGLYEFTNAKLVVDASV